MRCFFSPEASQPLFLLQFHLHLKSHLSYHSLCHPWILTLRAALQRECFPREVSWLNAMTNYYSYLKAVAAVFNFTVSSYSVLLKCQHIVHGSPVNTFSSLGGQNRCFCLPKMLQALAAEMVSRLSEAIFMGRLVFRKEMCLQSMKWTFLHRGK